MTLHKSGEDYLEAILILQKQNSVVFSVDVANYLSFSKASVSRAVSNLKRDGYLIMQPKGELVLTPKGKAVAENIYERHTLLASLLQRLGVSSDTAVADACKIEHAISDESFHKIKEYMQKLK